MSDATLLLSDLHLRDPAEPAAQWFAAALQQARQEQASVFILGDLFEAWIGDDAPGAIGEWVSQQLSMLSESGHDVYFIHGNRDFLLGENYARQCGMHILNGPRLLQLQQGPTLILHGDELCTDDRAYQQFRSQVRNPQWQQQFLQLPIGERIRQAQSARSASSEHTRQSAADIMDVNEQAVQQMFNHFGVRHMIHGHTHRPALHRYPNSQGERTRMVLGDWHEHAAPMWLTEKAMLL